MLAWGGGGGGWWAVSQQAKLIHKFLNFVLKNEASKTNFNLNKRMLIPQPFLHWVYKGRRKGRKEGGGS